MAPEATITGVDQEPAWVHEAAAIAEQAGLVGRFSYQQGPVEVLPFPDASFDLCWRALASVPRLAVAALLAGVSARFLADELDCGARFDRA
jgi:hypothetical protein